ncbi:MAG TPA: alpha/beta hydrolase, partial [Acidimicrobiales bacterium]
RTIEHNPGRSESSLRRGILHNAVQLDDGSWVWRHSRWRVGQPEEAAVTPPTPAAGPDTTLYDDMYDTVAAIKVPVLLARGMRQDSVLRDDDEAELLKRLPSAKVVRFEEAGHSVQGDMPVELAATIKDFIP